MNYNGNVWLLPPDNLTLRNDETHVWRVSLCLPQMRAQALQQLLTRDELNRADRFYFTKDRNDFIAAQGLLRTILSRYLQIEPNQLQFIRNRYGKPFLQPAANPGGLSFNLSHSARLALLAITRQWDIGVDLEQIRREFAFEEIARRFFSADEAALLRSLPDAIKPEAFFNCWTRKEAYVKAQGKGLSIPLNSFSVSLRPGEPARLTKTRDKHEEMMQWILRELKPGDRYVGALAVKGVCRRLKCWQWSE